MESVSPVPGKTVSASSDMSFLEALKVVIDGGKVTRLEWDNKEHFVTMNGGFLSLHKDGLHQWIVSEVDVQADDWMTV